MNILGFVYISLGIFLIFIPLLFIELGRPNDFIKSGISLLIGFFLIINSKDENYLFFSVIILLYTFLIALFFSEISFFRWNQLSEDEKKKLKNFSDLKNKFFLFFKAIKISAIKVLDTFDFLKKKEVNKKWVRRDDDSKSSTSNKNN